MSSYIRIDLAKLTDLDTQLWFCWLLFFYSVFSFQNEGYLIVLIVSILTTCLLVSSLILLASRHWRNPFCSNERSLALSVSGSRSCLQYHSPSQPQRFGTVRGKLRPHSRPVSGVQDFDWLGVTMSPMCDTEKDTKKLENEGKNVLILSNYM